MKLLAWVAFGLAIIAGAGLAATNAGMVQILVVAGALVVAGIDIAKDRTPNQYAIFVVLALPSLVVGMNGKLAGTIADWLNDVWRWAEDTLGSWVGATSVATTAIVVAGFAVITAQRIMPRTGSGMHR